MSLVRAQVGEPISSVCITREIEVNLALSPVMSKRLEARRSSQDRLAFGVSGPGVSRRVERKRLSQLAMLEKARAWKRDIEQGMTRADIARREGCSRAWVTQVLQVLQAIEDEGRGGGEGEDRTWEG